MLTRSYPAGYSHTCVSVRPSKRLMQRLAQSTSSKLGGFVVGTGAVRSESGGADQYFDFSVLFGVLFLEQVGCVWGADSLFTSQLTQALT